MSHFSHKLDNCKITNKVGLYLLPIICFAIFLFTCIISVGKDGDFFTFGNFCTIIGIAYFVGILFSLIAYFTAKNKCAKTTTDKWGDLMWKDYKLELKINIYTSVAILIGMILTYWVLWILFLPVFSTEFILNMIRFLGMFGFPCLIALGILFVGNLIDEKVRETELEI